MAEWSAYADEGDRWIIAYALVSGLMTVQTASLSIIGHAVELYLKAAHIKLYNDEDRAIGHGHHLQDIWRECRQRDPNFMRAYDIRDSILSKDFFDPKVAESFSEPDLLNFDYHRSLYAIIQQLQNLKYFGLPWKPKPRRPGGMYGVVTEHRDRYWIRFFKDLRNYLGYPSASTANIIKFELEHSAVSLPPETAAYLKAFIE